MLRQQSQMVDGEIEKSTLHHIGEIIEYEPNSVYTKTLVKRPTGSINVIAFDAGVGIKSEKYPFETFILLLEGHAEIVLDKKTYQLSAFNGIIIPANCSYLLKAIARFKIISVIIKSGYEEFSPGRVSSGSD